MIEDFYLTTKKNYSDNLRVFIGYSRHCQLIEYDLIS